MHWNLKRDLIEFANQKEAQALQPFVEALALQYQSDGDWQAFTQEKHKFARTFDWSVDNKTQIRQLLPAPRERRKGKPRKKHRPDHDGFSPRHDRAKPPRRAPPDRHPPPKLKIALYDATKNHVLGPKNLKQYNNWIAIKNSEVTLGYLVTMRQERFFDRYEANLLATQKKAFIFIAGALIIITFLVSLPLARHFTKPIQQLAARLHQLTQANFKAQKVLQRKDELGQLSRDVEQLAITLSETDNLRKRWFANISHELRTPIAIMRGEIEAILDGVRPLDLTQIESFEQEIKQLQRLVDHLYALGASDVGGMNYKKEMIDIVELLNIEYQAYQTKLTEQNMTLHFDFSVKAADVYADADRLGQLFNNLIINAVKYAGANTQLTVKLTETKQALLIQFCDNGQGVPESELTHLFEHLYRVEASRNRKTGGSGLGLALCKQIVDAHQGQIWAQKTQPHGLTVCIQLPTQ
ncbi:two-component sensor histidine kinase [Catenovulum sp. SM1970]|uniref:ATP-binding protein n=1 Tax=Marinifaba aquimaris TaxID=2741323 RepID=UPI0015745193|nr:ATP-binding protein [Marinifaba aquimaris]NTS77459.1 two-component sensor histidine kinase [Marinifaba aquimaris]